MEEGEHARREQRGVFEVIVVDEIDGARSVAQLASAIVVSILAEHDHVAEHEVIARLLHPDDALGAMELDEVIDTEQLGDGIADRVLADGYDQVALIISIDQLLERRLPADSIGIFCILILSCC